MVRRCLRIWGLQAVCAAMRRINEVFDTPGNAALRPMFLRRGLLRIPNYGFVEFNGTRSLWMQWTLLDENFAFDSTVRTF